MKRFREEKERRNREREGEREEERVTTPLKTTLKRLI